MLKANQAWVAAEQQRLMLREERAKKTRAWLDWLFSGLYRAAGSWGFYLAWTAVVLGVGWVLGINTPHSVVCSTRTSLCYRVRLRPFKMSVDRMPDPKCTRSPNGLICSLEVQPPLVGGR